MVGTLEMATHGGGYDGIDRLYRWSRQGTGEGVEHIGKRLSSYMLYWQE